MHVINYLLGWNLWIAYNYIVKSTVYVYMYMYTSWPCSILKMAVIAHVGVKASTNCYTIPDFEFV